MNFFPFTNQQRCTENDESRFLTDVFTLQLIAQQGKTNVIFTSIVRQNWTCSNVPISWQKNKPQITWHNKNKRQYLYKLTVHHPFRKYNRCTQRTITQLQQQPFINVQNTGCSKKPVSHGLYKHFVSINQIQMCSKKNNTSLPIVSIKKTAFAIP